MLSDTQLSKIYQEMCDTLLAGLMLVDAQRRIVLANPRAEEVFACEPGTRVGMPVSTLENVSIRINASIGALLISGTQSLPWNKMLEISDALMYEARNGSKAQVRAREQ